MSNTDGSAMGTTVALGFIHEGNHEFSWESGYLGASIEGGGTERWIPLWINYRYYFPLGSDKILWHIGPTFGANHVEVSDTIAGSDSSFMFTYGVGTGLTLYFNEKLALDTHYRYLRHAGGKIFGVPFSPEVHVISVGLSYTF